MGHSPTRLLAVQEEILRIVSTESEYYRYAALSYCWGRMSEHQRIFLTTKSNITTRTQGFHLDELPLTIRDAIRTARVFNIDYIWIDAICIIQDDVEDWGRESSQMDKVYRHAYLTFAAANSESSFDGFLHDRDPSCRASLGFTFEDFKDHERQTGLIHFRYPLETSTEDYLSQCKWEKRGWTLQERLLATRALTFTKEAFYYECAALQKAEKGYKPPRRLKLSVLLPESINLLPDEKLLRRQDYISSWYELVKNYSIRELSCASDKLPAIEGLAATLRDLTQDSYVWGLWKSDIHRGLLWQTYGTWTVPRGRYRGPTWFWVSRDGPVFWDESITKRKWRSLVETYDISPHLNCMQCNQTRTEQLELVAPMTSLKDYLFWDDDEWVPETLEEFIECGYDCPLIRDDESGVMPIFLADTKIVLIVEDETGNPHTILAQRLGDSDSNCFRRVGRLSDIRGKFMSTWPTFESERIILV